MSGPPWGFHATSRRNLPDIKVRGLRPSTVSYTSRSRWRGKPLLFFGTSITTVVPYAHDYVSGVILRFPFPERFELNPDQEPEDAEAVTRDGVEPHQIGLLREPVSRLFREYEKAGGYERSGPSDLIERLADSASKWQPLVKNADVTGLGLAQSIEQGKTFETGRPVTFRYVRSTERSPNFGARFGQDIEPAGRYLVHNEDPGDLPRGWESGRVSFERPLVLALVSDPSGEIYGPDGWKARLHRAFGGRKGKALSRHLAKLGYDGIVTCDSDGYTREIVDISMFGEK